MIATTWAHLMAWGAQYWYLATATVAGGMITAALLDRWLHRGR